MTERASERALSGIKHRMRSVTSHPALYHFRSPPSFPLPVPRALALPTSKCHRIETSSSMPLTSTRLSRDLVKILRAYRLPSRCSDKRVRSGRKKGKGRCDKSDVFL